MTSSWDWVPADVARAVEQPDPAAKRLVIRADACSGDVMLGEVPAGWLIEVRSPQGRRVAAEAAGVGVRWLLQVGGKGTVTLGSQLRVVHVTGGDQQVRLRLTSNACNLYVSPGAYQVNDGRDEQGDASEPLGYRLWADRGDDGGQIVISGSARPRRLSGSHPITVRRSLVDAKVDLDKSLTVIGDLSNCETKVGSTLTCRSIDGGSVEAHSVVVEGAKPQDECRVSARRIVTDSLRVAGPVAGEPEKRLDLQVGKSLQAVSLADVRLSRYHPSETEESPARASVVVHDAISNSELCDPVADVRAGSLDGSVTIADAETISIDGDSSGEFELHASERLDTKGVVDSSGRLSAPEVNVQGELRGVAAGIVVEGRDRIEVTRTATDATLVCRDAHTDAAGEIMIGRGARDLSVSKAALTLNKVVPAKPTGKSQQSNTAVSRCLIVTDGSARLVPNLVNSAIRATGTVVLGGDFDACQLDAPGLLARHPGAVSDGPETWTAMPLRAGDAAVAGQVRLLDSQTVVVALCLSARAVHGGSVQVTREGGRCIVGELLGTKVGADRLGVAGTLTDSCVQVGRLLHVGGAVDRASQVEIAGGASFKDRVDGTVRWCPDKAYRCHFASGAAEVDVTTEVERGTGSTPMVRLAAEATLQELTLQGTVGLTVDGQGSTSSRAGPVSGRLRLKPDAVLKVDGEGHIDIGEVTLDRNATFAQLGEEATKLTARLGRASAERDLVVDLPGVLILETPDSGGPTDVGGDPPRVRLRGTHLVARTALQQVACEASSPRPAGTLSVEAEGSIAALAGRFKLAELNGRLTSVSGSNYLSHRIRRIRRWLGRRFPKVTTQLSQARRSSGSSASAPAAPAQLIELDVAPPDEKGVIADLHGGYLVGVDVSELAFEDVRSLAALYVFDPDGATLTAAAAEQGDDAFRQDRAQRFKLLADTVKDTAVSGATRSAVLWASARAHHAAASAKAEGALRWLHRLVGYGQRPIPAGLTFAGWIVGATALLHAFDQVPPCASPASAADPSVIEAPYSFSDQLVRVLLLPAGLLRLDPGAAETYAPIRCHAGWQLTGFAITGLLLVYLLVAMRNYLRTPTGE